jgi:hypothetical protein
MGFGINKITGSSGLGIKTPSVVKKFNDRVDDAWDKVDDWGKDLLPKPPEEPPPGPAMNQGAGAVNAKSFGNVAYSETSLYAQGQTPGSIDTSVYKK